MYGDDWRDLVGLLRLHTNALSDENTTALATTRLLFKELGIDHHAIFICLLHQISNAVKPPLNYLTWARTQPWNSSGDDCGVDRSKSISLQDLANEASEYLKKGSKNERARPQYISAMQSVPELRCNLIPFKRVVGNRGINLWCNVLGLLERRECLKELSILRDKQTGAILSDHKLFYEYAHSSVWYRETLVGIAFDRAITSPLLRALNTSHLAMANALIFVKLLNINIGYLIENYGHETNKILQVFLNFKAIDPIPRVAKEKRQISHRESTVLGLLCLNHLGIGSDSNRVDYVKWNQNGIALRDWSGDNELFSKDIFYQNVLKLSSRELKCCTRLFYGMLKQFHTDFTKRIAAQGFNSDSRLSEGVFSNNDLSERAVGIRKQIKKSKPHISQQSNAALAITMQNNPFDILDALYEENEREFQWILKRWWELMSYKQSHERLMEERQRLQHKRAEKAKLNLSKAERTPVSVKKSQQKEVKPILGSKPPLSFVNWSMWLQVESAINTKWQHQGRKQWRHNLKVELKRAIKEGFPTQWKKNMNNWGIGRLHNELYRLCVLCATSRVHHVTIS